ncbi:MAG: Fe(3+) ABC transporter substrate-binding protein [Rhodobacteraceae bacterium]|nr:Fe(3+) ABC transporter substrate-binding protein [Paracoccaceae bacterium]
MKFLSNVLLVAGSLNLAAATVASSNEVNVYSLRQPELIEPMLNAFTDATGIAVNISYIKEGVTERLAAEGDRSPADLLLTVDISRLHAAVAAGVTQSVSSDSVNASVPEEFRDPDGHWFALTLRARIVYASKERVADGEVTTYEDLASDKWNGRICTRSGSHAYNIALTSAVLAHHGEDGARQWLSGVKSNLARKPQGNDRAQVKAIWAGECDVSIGNTYYFGKMLANEEQREWADAVRIEFPVFEGGGTHVNVSGMAMTKAAPNRDNALMLMEFLAGNAAQEMYAETNYEYPVNPNVSLSDLVASWGQFDRDGLSLAEIAQLRPQSLQIVEEIDFDE